jgi:phosphate transport system substrate-binding protein
VRSHLAPAFLGALLLAGCPASKGDDADSAKNSIEIKGSDTMVHLVTNWAENYMKAHPGSEVSVTGGGSGTGIAAMINGTTDLCMASRQMKPKEIELAGKQGAAPVRTVVARDGIALVVNPKNPISELTTDQLRQIFNGSLKSWKEVGGPDQPIQVLSRESSSGTYAFFNEHVMKKDDYSTAARLMPSTAAIIESCSQDQWSIGYVGLGYTKGADVKILAVKAGPDAPAVVPSLKTVADESYVIARPLQIYTRGAPAGLGKSFVDYCLSPEGQKVVVDTGYIPLQASN